MVSSSVAIELHTGTGCLGSNGQASQARWRGDNRRPGDWARICGEGRASANRYDSSFCAVLLAGPSAEILRKFQNLELKEMNKSNLLSVIAKPTSPVTSGTQDPVQPCGHGGDGGANDRGWDGDPEEPLLPPAGLYGCQWLSRMP